MTRWWTGSQWGPYAPGPTPAPVGSLPQRGGTILPGAFTPNPDNPWAVSPTAPTAGPGTRSVAWVLIAGVLALAVIGFLVTIGLMKASIAMREHPRPAGLRSASWPVQAELR